MSTEDSSSGKETVSSTKEMVPFVIFAISFIILLAWLSKALVFWESIVFSAHTAAPQPSATPFPTPRVQPSSGDNATLNQFLEWQLSQISAEREKLMAEEKQWDETEKSDAAKFDEAASKARQVEGVLTNLATDVYKLSSSGDDIAKQIVAELHMSYNTPSPSPSPGP